MARMHSRRKGKSGSTKPLTTKKVTWQSYDEKELRQIIVKLAKEQKTASQIGLILRDSYGVPDTRETTKKKITNILKENKLLAEFPEDFTNLIRREIALVKHLEKNKKDMTAKRGLQLTESKLQSLTNYYKKTGKLPADWKYDREKVRLLIG